MKKISNIKFFSRLLSVFMSVVALLCLFSPYAIAEDTAKFDENDVKWNESKAQAYYRQNNLQKENLSKSFVDLYKSHDTTKEEQKKGKHNQLNLVILHLNDLQNYTTSAGRDDFGGGLGLDSAAFDTLQAINRIVGGQLKNGYLSTDEAQIIYDEANRLYKIGSERAYLAAKAAGAQAEWREYESKTIILKTLEYAQNCVCPVVITTNWQAAHFVRCLKRYLLQRLK